MNEELEAIKDKWGEKTAAKERAFVAMQAASLDEKEGRDSSANWAAWEVDGIKGNEGRLADEQLALCDAYVDAHPGEFAELEKLSLEECVTALSVFRDAGMDESQWRVEVWLRHHFEPQSVGGEVKARVRMPGMGG